VWDLAHIGHYEELWLLRAVARTRPINPKHDVIYDAFRHPRRERARLEILGPADARRHIAAVRNQVLDVLDRVELDPAQPLLDGGFVYGMVVQHEHQHDETMLATIQLMGGVYGAPTSPVAPVIPSGSPGPAPEVLVPGGPFVMGTDHHPFAYDNERGAHVVDLDPFWIDTAPVTNADYLAFIEAGGYHDPRFWTEAGWAWRREAGLEAPEFWRRESGADWSVLRYGRRLDLAGAARAEPVQHVCFHEAEAYARFAGKRLPTEAEWEKAASWGPDGQKRVEPWGDHNLGQRHLGPVPVGTCPDGNSAYGLTHVLGDVWEWTSSDFVPYPGFVAFPYKEYSDVFYGSDYKVLRGGSWATHPRAIRTTFRNWDYPIRRQIFAGFRCARDA
jgi:iron(II)-dependent oxidoreductase